MSSRGGGGRGRGGDALHAFASRADAYDLIGQAYASGALSLTQVTTILGVSPSDAVFELEARGHYRSREALAMSRSEEDELVDALRRDREERGGEPDYSEAHVIRDAIASERIEGVDARRWLGPRRA